MARRGETVTLLFTDLVSSTELLQRAGDDAAQRIFKAHHRMLSDAVSQHGGQEVKWLGDGLMVAFPSATDAVRCAIALQQAARRPAEGERLAIRVGLNVGDALVEDSDYFGTPVVIARRLCDRADAGQILASDMVVRLVGNRQEFAFEDLGACSLKGIANPVQVAEVRYAHDPVAMIRQTPFVGRGDVMAALAARLDRCTSGAGSLVMLVGEPGIGKTRTMEEFAEQARASGVAVLYGRCYDGEWAPPFSPFMEAVRAYASSTPDEELLQTLGGDAGVLARIVPALRERLPDIAEPPPIPAEGERYRLLEAAGDFFARLAQARPLVLVLDDLHWADMGTVAMLRQLARVAPRHRMLIVGAYRDIELDRTHPLADALQSLRRETNYERIVLRGLQLADVSQLLAIVAERDVPEPFVQAISSETGGNPFFIREVMLHLVEEGRIVEQDGRWTAAAPLADMRIPEGVREVIGRRLSRVSDACGRMLTTASALTAGFSWDVVRAVTDLPDAALLDAIDEALAAQLIAEGVRGRYEFTHALIRHTLYEELSTPRRMLLHRTIGEALERLYAGDIEAHVAELAHHFSEAGDEEKGVEYCRRAALGAARVAGYDEAAAFIDRALALNRDLRTRCELLLLLGRMQFYRGMQLSSLDPFVEAADIARQLGDAHLLARAAINEGRIWPHGDERFGPLLREALEALGDEESALRAQAMILQANRTGFDLGREGVIRVVDEATDMVRRYGDTQEQARVLMHRWLIRQTMSVLDPTLDCVEAAREFLTVAERAGDHELLRAGRITCYWALMDLGRVAESEEHMVAHAALTDASKIPADMHVTVACLASLATMQGRFDEAEQLIADAGRFDERGAVQARPIFMLQSALLRVLQGRLDEARALLSGNHDPIFWATGGGGYTTGDNLKILVAAFAGDADAAARAFADARPPDGPPQERLQYARHRAAVAPDAIALTGDRNAAARFYERLLPWAHRPLSIGLYSNLGSASRQLGVLATVLERYDDAERHFEEALAMNARMGARPWLARTQLDYARMLRKRGAAGDAARSRELLQAALGTAREIGMAGVARDCEQLLQA